jgi:hypothetical protein
LCIIVASIKINIKYNMQNEANLNPQTQTPETGYIPETTPQAIPEADFSAPAQDFSYFDPSQTVEPQTQAPTADYYNTGEYTDFSQPQQTVGQDYYAQPVDIVLDPALGPVAAANLQNQTVETVNTFSEQKTGNKNLLYIAIAGVAVLLLLAGGLVWYNLTNKPAEVVTNNQPKTEEPVPTPEPAMAKIDNSLSGGDNTPASKQHKNSDSKTTLEWNKKSFTSPSIDAEGNCIVLETCGLDSDKDRDGLTTLQEYQYASDPLNEDTDGDKIADGDEVFVYFSNPVNKDSDTDTYSDGEEVVSCFDPNAISADNFSTNRLTLIGNGVSLKTLHEPTIKTLKAAGATQVDINSKATVSAKCLKPSAEVSNTDAVQPATKVTTSSN